MMGSFLSRALLLIFGYAYPAYECFKIVEMNKTDIEQLPFWCRYWILVALLTVCERVGDHLISWLPLYCEAKLAFFIYLWHPKTKGTEYIYNCFFRPFMANHEDEIDRNLIELRVRTEKIALVYWLKAATYGQAKFFEILQYVSSQSVLPPHPDQNEPNSKDGGISHASSSIRETENQPENPQLHSSSSAPLSEQSDEIAGELEDRLSEAIPLSENRTSDSSQQEIVLKESLRPKHGRWKLFQSPTKLSNS